MARAHDGSPAAALPMRAGDGASRGTNFACGADSLSRTGRPLGSDSLVVAVLTAWCALVFCTLLFAPTRALAQPMVDGDTRAGEPAVTAVHSSVNDAPDADALSGGLTSLFDGIGDVGRAIGSSLFPEVTGGDDAASEAVGDADGAQDAAASDEAGLPAEGPTATPSYTEPASADGLREEAVQAAAQSIYAAILDGTTGKVDIEDLGITEGEYLAAVDRLVFEPRCIHWKSTSYSMVQRGGVSYVISFTLEYRLDDAAVATYQSDLDAALAELVAQIDPAASSYDKALYVYDWLANNVTYASDVADGGIVDSIARTPLGALRYGTAVCSGYASAFELAMEALGIECDFVNSPEMDHSWNVVNIDGTWYYADATWDDADDGLGSQHFYFLVSEQTLARDHWGWTPEHEAPVDLERPGIIRYTPGDGYTLADAALEVVYSGYGGKADILDHWVSGDDFNAMMYDLDTNGYFGGMYFEWSCVTNESGYVKYFTITHH